MKCYNDVRREKCAGVAQLAEQLICNQQVGGSNPSTSSTTQTSYGGIPERPKGADCKSVVTDFGGPNPPSPTKQKDIRLDVLFLLLGGEKNVDSEARAHNVGGQKQSGGLFLGRGLRLCSQSAGNERASCAQLAFLHRNTFPHQAKGHPIGCPFLIAWWGKEGGFGSPGPWRSRPPFSVGAAGASPRPTGYNGSPRFSVGAAPRRPASSTTDEFSPIPCQPRWNVV